LGPFDGQIELSEEMQKKGEMIINPHRIVRIEGQTVSIEDFPVQGFILDIGGGGEGVIGQLKGAQVVAIDIFSRELEESPAGPLKIVMDARELKFLDATFNTVTAFFAFMFVRPDDHAKVFQEIFRVLAPGGQLLLWDIDIQQRLEPQKDIFAFSLHVSLPATIINTGYGTPYTEEPLALEHYVTLAKKAGFALIEQSRAGRTFFCKYKKP
jgi:ubiquinone/menaquinone biosynthesis C-methylase UbiE